MQSVSRLTGLGCLVGAKIKEAQTRQAKCQRLHLQCRSKKVTICLLPLTPCSVMSLDSNSFVRTAKVQALRNGLAPDKEIQAAKRAKLIHSRGPPEFPSEPTCNIVTMREQKTFTRKQAKAAAAIREATTVPGEY